MDHCGFCPNVRFVWFLGVLKASLCPFRPRMVILTRKYGRFQSSSACPFIQQLSSCALTPAQMENRREPPESPVLVGGINTNFKSNNKVVTDDSGELRVLRVVECWICDTPVRHAQQKDTDRRRRSRRVDDDDDHWLMRMVIKCHNRLLGPRALQQRVYVL